MDCNGCFVVLSTPYGKAKKLESASCESPWQRRVTKSEAMQSYGLNKEEHFHGLNEVNKSNPHYRSAAPMRLFLVYQLLIAVQKHKKGAL